MSDLRDRLQQALGSAYSIERELGGGGMSRVFVATEHALGRQVVVKVVRVDGGEGAGERFRREITTAAQLQHPHIVPVLTAGDAGGTPYFTMPFVAGDSLRARVAGRGPLGISEATKILRDVAQALAFAHERGFVHRDIKPDNVLLADGAAVVTDFGVAKALSSATGAATAAGITAAGTTLGTPAYMAPEQISADPVMDHRVDIYAWGCMAYELLTGVTPFGSRTPSQLFAAHLTETAAPLATRRNDTPPALAALVTRCLQKDPARRPQSAREMVGELDAIASTSGPRTGATFAPRSRRPQVILGVAAAIVIATGILMYRTRDSRDVVQAGQPVPSAPNPGSSIAVMPFVNTSGDPKDEYFSDGMTDELTHALTKLPGIHLAGRSSSFSFKGRTVPAQEIGKTLGVGAIIEGSVRRSGDRIRVTAQLVGTEDGQVRWSDSFERAGTDVFVVQDEFTSAILTALKPMLGGAQPTASSLDSRGTTDAEAYDLYLRGRYFWAQRGANELDSAIALFGKAVKRDPKFARGWSGLALAHVLRPNFNSRYAALPEFDSTEAAARKAIAIDSTLADAHLALAFSRMRRVDIPTAAAGFARARQLEPQNPTTHHWSAIYFGIVNDTLQAEREIELAITLDPLSATTINSRGSIYLDRRRFAEALDLYGRTMVASSAFATKYSNSPRPLIWTGRADSAYRFSLSRLAGSTQRGRFGSFVFAAAAAGHWDVARAMRDSIARTSSIEILDFDRGIAALTFGDRARAAELLVRSFEKEGSLGNIVFSTCDPILDDVRDESVFAAYLQKHGISRCPFRSPWPIGAPPAEKTR